MLGYYWGGKVGAARLLYLNNHPKEMDQTDHHFMDQVLKPSSPFDCSENYFNSNILQQAE